MRVFKQQKTKAAMKAFRNFLIVNLFAVIPLWWIGFGWMPDQVKVYLRGAGGADGKTVSLVVDGSAMLGEDCGIRAGCRVFRFYLRDGTKWKNLVFRFSGDSCADAVERIELQKWKLIALVKAGGGLRKVDSGGNEYRYDKPRFEWIAFASQPIGVAVVGLECLLFILSYFLAGRHHEERLRTLLPSVLGVSLALTLLIQVTLPIQSFIANHTSFPFALSPLCKAVAMRFVLLFAWNTLAVFLLAHCFGRRVLTAVFAFTVCAYLESSILAEGLPSLNGDWSFFADRMRMRWDAAVWSGVFFLAFAVHRWLKDWQGVAGLCVAGMAIAGIFDATPEETADTSNLLVHDFSPIETVVRSVAYSTNRNVMIFVIDSLEREQAHAIMEDPEVGPELKKRFRGFTEYLDNMGACGQSLPADANLFTGRYPDNAWNLFKYFGSVYSDESILKDYLSQNYAVCLGTTPLNYGYCNLPHDGSSSTFKNGVLNVYGTSDWTLSGIAKFRWLPFIAKRPYLYLFDLKRPESSFNHHEWTIYPILGEAPLSLGNRKMFLFMHTFGVHMPIWYTRRGEKQAVPLPPDKGGTEMGVYCLEHLARLFEQYREKGIYDNSMFVVMADHGRVVEDHGTPDVLPFNARPFLWVKPIGCTNEFRTSFAPTSHANIAGMLREASAGDLSGETIEKLLQGEKRTYRRLHEGMGPKYHEWSINRDGSVFHREGRLLALPSSELRPLDVSRKYSLENHEISKNGVQILFSNVDFWMHPVFVQEMPSMDFTFRVPQKNMRYTLHIFTKCTRQDKEDSPGAQMFFRQAAPGQDWIPYNMDYRAEIVLHGIIPDSEGMVTIEGKRGNGLNSQLHFMHMMLEADK